MDSGPRVATPRRLGTGCYRHKGSCRLHHRLENQHLVQNGKSVVTERGRMSPHVPYAAGLAVPC